MSRVICSARVVCEMSSKFSGGWNGFTIEPLAENTDDVGNVAGDDDTLQRIPLH